MSGTEVDFGTLERIRRTLTTASGGLEDCGGAAPTGVDGGDLSSLITSMIAKVTESAGGLSEGLERRRRAGGASRPRRTPAPTTAPPRASARRGPGDAMTLDTEIPRQPGLHRVGRALAVRHAGAVRVEGVRRAELRPRRRRSPTGTARPAARSPRRCGARRRRPTTCTARPRRWPGGLDTYAGSLRERPGPDGRHPGRRGRRRADRARATSSRTRDRGRPGRDR